VAPHGNKDEAVPLAEIEAVLRKAKGDTLLVMLGMRAVANSIDHRRIDSNSATSLKVAS
jgi:hypothetical protein